MATSLAGADTLDRTRKILLPREEFLRLGQTHANGVYLEGADLERLHARIAAARAADAAAGESGPTALTLASASYQAELLPGKLRVIGQLDFVSDQNGWQATQLPGIGALFLAEATSGELYLSREGDRVRADAFGPGSRSVRVGFDVRLDNQRATLELGSPGELVVSVPESVQPTMDGVVLETIQDSERPGRQLARVPLRRGAMTLEFRPRRIVSAASLVEVSGHHRVRVTAGLMHVEHVLEIDSWSSPMQQFEVALPDGAAVSTVSVEELRAQTVADRRLRIELARPCSSVRLKFETIQPVDLSFTTKITVPTVVGARWSTAVLDIERNDELQLVVRPDLQAQAMPAGVPAKDEVAESLGRYFLVGPEASVSLSAKPAQRRIQASLSSVYQITNDALSLTAVVRTRVTGAPLRHLDIELDAHDVVVGVTLEGAEDPPWSIAPAKDPKRRLLQVKLPAQAESQVRIHAERLLDRSALDGSLQLELEVMKLDDIEVIRNAVGLGVEPDLHVSLREHTGFYLRDAESSQAVLEGADSGDGATVSYVFLASPDATRLAIEVNRRKSRIDADTTTFVHFTEGALKLQAEVVFAIRDAATDVLRLALPPGTGSRIRIDVDGLQERALSSTPQADVWTLRLRERTLGQVRARVSFDEPIDSSAKQSVKVPEIGAVGASRDEGTILLEAADNLALRVTKIEARELQLEDLPAADFYAPTDRLLAAYRTLSRPYGMEVEVLRYEPLPLLGAVATQASLRTVVLADGRLWTEAGYSLNNAAAQFLPLALPPGTRLWSALLDEQPVKPFRRSESVLLPLHPGTQSVRLVYETQMTAPGYYSSLRVAPPNIGMPTLRLNWSLHPPIGYTASADGFGRAAKQQRVDARLPKLLEDLGQLTALMFTPPMLMLLSAPMEGVDQSIYEGGKYAAAGAASGSESVGQSLQSGYMAPATPPPAKSRANKDSEEADLERRKMKEAVPASTIEPEAPRIPAPGGKAGIGVLPLRLSLPVDTAPLQIFALSGEGELRVTMIRSEFGGRLHASLVLGVAGLCAFAFGLRPRRWILKCLALLLFLALIPGVSGAWLGAAANAATDGVLLGAVLTAILRRLRRPLPVMTRAFPMILAGLASVGLSGSAWAEEPMEASSPNTTVYVPYRLESGRLIEEARAFLSQDEFQRLFELGQPASKPEAGPASTYALRSVEWKGTLDNNGASLRMRLEFELPSDAWAEIPLTLPGSIAAAELDGAPVALVSDNGLRLVAHGRGAHALVLEMRLPDGNPGPEVLLELPRLPVAAGRLELRMPSGYTAEVVPDKGSELRPDGESTLLMATVGDSQTVVNGRPAPSGLARGIRAENWLEVRPLPNRFALNGRVILRAAGRLPEQLSLDVGASLALNSLRGTGLRSWRLERGRLVLDLQAGLEAVSLELEGDAGAGPDVKISALVPEGAIRISGGVLVRPAAGGLVELGEHSGLRQSDQASLLAAWPESAGPVQWSFVPESTRFDLSLRFVSGKPLVSCRPSVLMRLDKPGAELILAAEYDVRDWPVYELPVTMPKGWQFQSASSNRSVSWSTETTANGSTALARFADGAAGKVRLITRWTHAYGAAAASGLRVPVPNLAPAQLEAGEIAFSVGPGFDLTLDGDRRSELTPMDPSQLHARLDGWPVTQAYRYREPVETLARLTVQKARVTVTTVEHVMVGESHVEGRAVLLYDSSSPGIDALRFRVPQAVARTLEVSGAGVRNVEKSGTGELADVTVELQSPVQGTYPLEVSWTLALELEREVPLPRVLPQSPAPADAYLLIETDPVVLVSVTAQTDTETVSDLEQIPSLPSSLRPEQVRWMYRYRAATGALRVKAARPKTEDVLQAIVDSVDLFSVVDSEGRCRTRARFEMQNRTEQFLDVALPPDVELWSAAVAGQPVKPARVPTGRPGELRMPLPKQSVADLSFAAELWYVSRVPFSGLRGSFDLHAPRITNVPTKRTLWTLWLPAESKASFSGTLDEITEGELTSEKVMEVLDLQNRLVGALASTAGRKREKIVQNLANLSQQYGALDQTAQQQLSFDPLSHDARQASRQLKALDQLSQSRATFDENIRKVAQAQADDQLKQTQQTESLPQVGQQQYRQSLTENWALTGKGVEQISQNAVANQKNAALQPSGTEEVDLETVIFATDDVAANANVQALYSGLELRRFAPLEAAGSGQSFEVLFPRLTDQLKPRIDSVEATLRQLSFAGVTASEVAEPVLRDGSLPTSTPEAQAGPDSKRERPDVLQEQDPAVVSGDRTDEMGASDDSSAMTLEESQNELGDKPDSSVLEKQLADGEPADVDSAKSSRPMSPPAAAKPSGLPPPPKRRPEPGASVRGAGLAEAEELGSRRAGGEARPPVETLASMRREGYLSLQLDFPVEGQKHFFKSLQGEGTLRVHYSAASIWTLGRTLLLLIAGLLSLWFASRLEGPAKRGSRRLRRVFRRWAGVICIASLIVFVILWVPAAFVLALVAGFQVVRRGF